MAKRIANKLVDEETGEVLATEVTVAPIFWKTPYNHDTLEEAERTATAGFEPSLTQQQFKDDADINVIIERVLKGAQLPPVVLPEHFADISERPTYFDMQSRTAEANTTFYKLPAKKRAEFLNDPARWADEVLKATETGDLAKMKELGLDVSAAEEAATRRSEEAAALAAAEAAKQSQTPSGGTPAPDPGKPALTGG